MLEWGFYAVLIAAAVYAVYRVGVREAKCRIAAKTREKARAIERRAEKTHDDMANASDDTVRDALRGPKP